ncbi:hypothetical protein HYH03_004063 [Edaphochlamys debaryana]|uniref:RRM domain-containing protein n=1 Tax=Edaphochlamys debaryana TaxID=47281 RepID=A0A835Y846_9CHLO|nr:hypothetical protein HYH03_004063 [Edaphochlamys debaryana]|eukprot:KAG2497791.1 hypothetical protein HYH03_004063 [Edaphochlamys debaryana]
MAMEQLDEQHVFDATGTAMSVRWADPELQDRKKKAMDEANLDNRMLFFAKVLRSTTEEEVRRLFTRFGKVHDVNLFRAFQGAPTTKGCGLVTMSQHAEAVLAIATLDGKYVWEGMDCPMVVKWMDTALQRRRREQHLATIRQPLPSASIGGLLGGSRSVDQMSYQPAPSMPPLSAQALGGPGPSSTLVASSVQQQGGSGLGGGNQGLGGLMGNAGLMGRSGLMGGVSMGGLGGVGVSVPVGVGLGGGLGGSGLMNASGLMGGLGGGLGMPGLEGSALAGEPTETPPLGCNADAIKLFVGNIPKSCTEEQLLPLFQSIGKVVELVIVYDKVTHESKGSAFVWYATRTDAERAIIQFNLRHIFPDPTGAQDRPLVVRRAKARSRGPGAPGVLGGALGQPGLPMPYYQRMVGGVGMMGGVGLMPQGVAGLGGGMEALSLGGEGGGMGMMGGMQGVTVLGGGGDGGGAGHQGHRYIRMGGGQYDAYGAGDQLLNDYGGGGGGGYAVLQPAGGGGGMMGGAGAGQQWEAAGLGGQGLAAQAALSLSLNQQQLNAVHHHLFSLQTVSGAQLTLSASASPGLFNLVIAGGKAQVESARQLVERLAMV